MQRSTSLNQLADFLVRAKQSTYAKENALEITPERPGFKELEYVEGVWSYRDSYSGFYCAPGQEVVRFNDVPVWAMSYHGGMTPNFTSDVVFAKQTFGFLKKALALVDASQPFRGKELKEGDWNYFNQVDGNILNFSGEEAILFGSRLVFTQKYVGGLILHKPDVTTEIVK